MIEESITWRRRTRREDEHNKKEAKGDDENNRSEENGNDREGESACGMKVRKEKLKEKGMEWIGY